MSRNLNKEYFIETMAHIMTIEDILMARYNINFEEFNKQKNINKKDIEEQLKEV